MKGTILTGALAVAFCVTAQLAQAQQDAIPDAPHPQTTLPRIPAISPAQGTSAPAPAPTQPAAPATAPAAQQNGDNPSAAEVGRGAQSVLEIEKENQQPGTPQPGEKLYRLPTVRVNNVQVPFSVKDGKGNLVAGLLKNDIRVLENGNEMNIRFFSADPLPLSVAIVVDQSMAFNDMDKVNAALKSLQGAFANYDEIAYFTYNNGPHKVTNFTGAQSDRLQMAVQMSRSAGRDGLVTVPGGPMDRNIYKNNGTESNWDPNTNGSHGTRQNDPMALGHEPHTLNDAIYAAAKELTRVGRGRRRVIYVIGDGKEYGSQMKAKDVVSYLQHHEIAVYGTLVHDLPSFHIPGTGLVTKFTNLTHLPGEIRENQLALFSNATGGQIDTEWTTHGIETSIGRLAATARTQYIIYYSSPENKYDGKYRTIDVRVLGRPGLDVIAKPGYYPTADNAPATNAPTPPPTTENK